MHKCPLRAPLPISAPPIFAELAWRGAACMTMRIRYIFVQYTQIKPIGAIFGHGLMYELIFIKFSKTCLEKRPQIWPKRCLTKKVVFHRRYCLLCWIDERDTKTCFTTLHLLSKLKCCTCIILFIFWKYPTFHLKRKMRFSQIHWVIVEWILDSETRIRQVCGIDLCTWTFIWFSTAYPHSWWV